jgi:hypothetical protein
VHAPRSDRARPEGSSWTQRLLEPALTVNPTAVVGAETRPLTSNVIVAGAPLTVTVCDTALRWLSRSPLATADIVQPYCQPAPPRASETLALRLSASLRARIKSDIRS